MIDKTGRKITVQEEKEDACFIASEIRFIMKGFEKSNDDRRAKTAAERIKKFLKLDGEVSEIESNLDILEKYSLKSRSVEFLWELVYIRRLISAAYADGAGDLTLAAQNRYASAVHFERICELSSSYYYLCCRVMEYTSALAAYSRAASLLERKKETEGIVKKAEELFSQIEEKKVKIYYETGEYLYFQKFLSLGIFDDEEKLETIKKSLYYSEKSYEFDKKDESLRRLALVYSNYAECRLFCYSEEQTRFKNMIAEVERVADSGNAGMEMLLSRLKRRLAKCESA